MHRHAQCVSEGGGGHHPDPQTGERPGTGAHDHDVEIGGAGTPLGEHRAHRRRQQLPVAAGVDGDHDRSRPHVHPERGALATRPTHRPRGVGRRQLGKRDRARCRGCVKSHHQHSSRLRIASPTTAGTRSTTTMPPMSRRARRVDAGSLNSPAHVRAAVRSSWPRTGRGGLSESPRPRRHVAGRSRSPNDPA